MKTAIVAKTAITIQTAGGTIRSPLADQIVAPPAIGTTYRNHHAADDACAGPNEFAIAPGFRWEPDPVGPPIIQDAWGKPWKRFPTSTHNTQGWDQWEWGFFTSTGGYLTLYHNCLERISSTPSTGGTHRHKIAPVSKLKTIAGNNLKKDQVSEAQVECGEHYKAMLGAWNFGYEGYVWNLADHWKKLWYMGMDPRPKIRAFSVLNTDPAVDIPAGSKFGSLCFKTKTT